MVSVAPLVAMFALQVPSTGAPESMPAAPAQALEETPDEVATRARVRRVTVASFAAWSGAGACGALGLGCACPPLVAPLTAVAASGAAATAFILQGREAGWRRPAWWWLAMAALPLASSGVVAGTLQTAALVHMLVAPIPLATFFQSISRPDPLNAVGLPALALALLGAAVITLAVGAVTSILLAARWTSAQGHTTRHGARDDAATDDDADDDDAGEEMESGEEP